MEGLDSREVHLRIVRLEASEDNFKRSLAWLSADETARAKRFYFERHRPSLRSGTRRITSAACKLPRHRRPPKCDFLYGPQGKPALADPSSSLRFNVSNSGNLAAYAFTTGCEIGVDVEQHRALHDFENIARRFFSPEETAELLELPSAEKTAAFFDCWARKEAYIKAMGGGLSIPLDSFRVTLRPGVDARMVSIGGSEDAGRRWTFNAFDPTPGYAGAIAYRDEPRSLQASPVVLVDELLEELIPKAPTS